MTVQRVARRIVHLYPRGWRARYEPEICALIETSPLGGRLVLDVARGCASEWLRWSWAWRWRHTYLAPLLVAALVRVTAMALQPMRAGAPGWLVDYSMTAFVTLQAVISIAINRRAIRQRKLGVRPSLPGWLER